MHSYNWKTGLPRESGPATVAPVALEQFVDEEASARRIKGYDHLGIMCYYHHAFALGRERFDEEGLYDENEAYRQEITAWRLYTGGWLVRKYEAGAHGDCAGRLVNPDYWISETCPAEQESPLVH